MGHKTYLVGGAVRDLALGLDPRDRDYVVVGLSSSDMFDRGFTLVGRDFPVFHHPDFPEAQFALARRERKVAPGYGGFVVDADPSVTLIDDLFRRDLTINAMALEVDAGLQLVGGVENIIDPFNGLRDLKSGTLRHVSEAFAEDPLRILRVGRFAARYGFDVHPETLELSRRVLTELKFVSPERVVTELWKGFGEKHPSLMYAYLEKIGALSEEPLNRYFSAFKFQQCFCQMMAIEQDLIEFPEHSLGARRSVLAPFTESRQLALVLLSLNGDLFNKNEYMVQELKITEKVARLYNLFVTLKIDLQSLTTSDENGWIRLATQLKNTPLREIALTVFMLEANKDRHASAFLDKLQAVSTALDQLDFEVLLQDVPQKEKRDAVLREKRQAVTRALA